MISRGEDSWPGCRRCCCKVTVTIHTNKQMQASSDTSFHLGPEPLDSRCISTTTVGSISSRSLSFADYPPRGPEAPARSNSQPLLLRVKFFCQLATNNCACYMSKWFHEFQQSAILSSGRRGVCCTGRGIWPSLLFSIPKSIKPSNNFLLDGNYSLHISSLTSREIELGTFMYSSTYQVQENGKLCQVPERQWICTESAVLYHIFTDRSAIPN